MSFAADALSVTVEPAWPEVSAANGRVVDVTVISQAAEEAAVPPWAQVPSGWPILSEDLTEHAAKVVIAALATDGICPADERLARDAEITASNLLPGPADDVTTSDLLSVALQVPVPPVAVRRLLAHGGHRLEVLTALTELQDDDLVLASPSTLVAMENLLDVIRRAMSSGDASGSLEGLGRAELLCAHKRPGLFSALNEPIRAALGLHDSSHRRVDWLLIRTLLADKDVMTAVDDLGDRARMATGRTVNSVGPERLQILCAALNTSLSATGKDL